jgi:hypothetical protein
MWYNRVRKTSFIANSSTAHSPQTPMPQTKFSIALLRLIITWTTYFEDCLNGPVLQGYGNPFQSPVFWDSDFEMMQLWLDDGSAKEMAKSVKRMQEEESLEWIHWSQYSKFVKTVMNPRNELRVVAASIRKDYKEMVCPHLFKYRKLTVPCRVGKHSPYPNGIDWYLHYETNGFLLPPPISRRNPLTPLLNRSLQRRGTRNHSRTWRMVIILNFCVTYAYIK